MGADVTIDRKITVVMSGDLSGTQEYAAARNEDAAAIAQAYTLSAGNDETFVIPSSFVSGKVTKSLTIVKPSDYTGTLVIKGVQTALDGEGIFLHPTDPDSISIGPTQTRIVLKASEDCTVVLIWG